MQNFLPQNRLENLILTTIYLSTFWPTRFLEADFRFNRGFWPIFKLLFTSTLLKKVKNRNFADFFTLFFIENIGIVTTGQTWFNSIQYLYFIFTYQNGPSETDQLAGKLFLWKNVSFLKNKWSKLNVIQTSFFYSSKSVKRWLKLN